MARSIVPPGFESVAHPIFFQFTPPSKITGEKTFEALIEKIEFLDGSDLDIEEGTYKRHSEENTNSTNRTNNPNDSKVHVDIPSKNVGCINTDDTDAEGQKEEAESSLTDFCDRLEMTCAICLSQLDQPVTLCSCAHSFCRACLLTWYQHVPVHPTCPKCKDSSHYFVQGEGNPSQTTPSLQTSLFAVNVQRPILPPHLNQIRKAILIQKEIHSVLGKRKTTGGPITETSQALQQKDWKRRRHGTQETDCKNPSECENLKSTCKSQRKTYSQSK